MDPAILREIVRRIVDAVQPERIILFGSAVRGEMGRDSDVDVLVVKRCTHRRQTARAIRRKLIGVPIPIDIIVGTPDDVASYGNTIGLIYREALRQGREIYAA